MSAERSVIHVKIGVMRKDILLRGNTWKAGCYADNVSKECMTTMKRKNVISLKQFQIIKITRPAILVLGHKLK